MKKNKKIISNLSRFLNSYKIEVTIITSSIFIAVFSFIQIASNLHQQSHWQALADSARDRAATYLSICAKQPEFTGEIITQSTDCSGDKVDIFGKNLKNSKETNKSPAWRTTFTVKEDDQGDRSDHATRFSVVGTLEILGDASIVRKVYTSETSVIIDLDEISTSRMRNNVTNSNAYCVVRPSNLRFYCAFTQYVGKNLTEFILPSGEYVKDYRLLYGIDLSANSGCVVTNLNNLYCAGGNSNAVFSNLGVDGLITWDGTNPNDIGSGGIAGPVLIKGPGGSDLKVTDLWEGVNFLGNMCVMGSDGDSSHGNVFCTGINAMGNFGNGKNQTNTTNITGGKDVSDPNNPVAGTYPATPGFNSGDLDPSSGTRKVKKIYGHITYNPQQVKYMDRTAALPGNLLDILGEAKGCWVSGSFAYSDCKYIQRHASWRRCVLTTDKATSTDDQLYCAGVCSNTHGGILFGTAPKGSGALGCGASDSAPKTTNTSVGATVYNLQPDDYGGTKNASCKIFIFVCINNDYWQKGRDCFPSVWEDNIEENIFVAPVSDSKARCYWKPARFWLPNGVKVKQVNIGLGTTLGSYLCVYASDKKTYCTFSTQPNLNNGTPLLNISEPTDIEDKDIYNFGQPYPNPSP